MTLYDIDERILSLIDPETGEVTDFSALEALDFSNMKSDGYCFQIETTFKVWKKKMRVEEIPIIFTDRTKGESKMSGGIISEAFFLVIKLRLGLA